MLFSLTTSCNRSSPDDLIDEYRYINILAEMHLLAAKRELDEDEVAFHKGQKIVLEHYDITSDQFERSHDYYIRDAKEQQRRMQEVRRQLEEISSDLADYEQEMRNKRNAESSSESGTDP